MELLRGRRVTVVVAEEDEEEVDAEAEALLASAREKEETVCSGGRVSRSEEGSGVELLMSFGSLDADAAAIEDDNADDGRIVLLLLDDRCRSVAFVRRR